MESDFKFIQPGEIRVRIAPSPTGPFHIGTARTALFNYLFARKFQGTFILRIEDTDKERSERKAEEEIMDSLKWLGIEWEEGPDIGGKYGPYRQSERGEIYKKYLEKLLKENKAYFCFCTEEELEAQRQYQMSIGKPPVYSGRCRNLSSETVKRYLAEKRKFIIRFKTPAKKIEFKDLIRGKINFDCSLLGDFAIAKGFDFPLYNFACVVDDFEMKISHVIRGEDHISNTPKQILLQEALGFPKVQYAHLPLILGPDRAKLSKRHGPVSILELRKQGFLPEAIINFIAFLGWNPKSEKEIYSLNSLIKEFSLEGVQKSGAVCNFKKLEFLNGFYIRQKSIDKLTELCLPYLISANLILPIFRERQYPPAYGGKEIIQKYKVLETGEEIDLETIQKIISIYQGRLKKLSEIPELVDFFFKEKLDYPKELLRWKESEDEIVKKALDRLEDILSKVEIKDWQSEKLQEILVKEAESFASEIQKVGDRGYLLWTLRVALSGKRASAPPFEIAEILGKEKTLRRIKMGEKLFLEG